MHTWLSNGKQGQILIPQEFHEENKGQKIKKRNRYTEHQKNDKFKYVGKINNWVQL
jgi:hypothetical protein